MARQVIGWIFHCHDLGKWYVAKDWKMQVIADPIKCPDADSEEEGKCELEDQHPLIGIGRNVVDHIYRRNDADCLEKWEEWHLEAARCLCHFLAENDDIDVADDIGDHPEEGRAKNQECNRLTTADIGRLNQDCRDTKQPDDEVWRAIFVLFLKDGRQETDFCHATADFCDGAND